MTQQSQNDCEFCGEIATINMHIYDDMHATGMYQDTWICESCYDWVVQFCKQRGLRGPVYENPCRHKYN